MKASNPLLDEVDVAAEVISCRTCAHRGSFNKCERTGYYCSTEMQYGGQCNQNGELTLWTRRPGAIAKIWRKLF